MVTAAKGSREKFDIRSLAELSARYRQAIEQDWIAHGRYIGLLREVWNANGNREVDKVPISLEPAVGNMRGRDVWATDAEGLGAVMGVYDFNVDHDFGQIAFPDHHQLSLIHI